MPTSVPWQPSSSIAIAPDSGSGVQGLVPTQPFDLEEIYEEAFSRLGLEFRESYQIIDGNRSLRLLLQEWSNRGINLWTITQDRLVLVTGYDQYQTPFDTTDVLNCFIRMDEGLDSQQDYYLARVSNDDFDRIPQKNMQQQPAQYCVRKIGQAPMLSLWPVPDQPYIFYFSRMRSLKSPTAGLTGEADAPARMMGALVAGIAFYLSLKYKDAFQLQPILKAEYDRQFEYSQREDREKSDLQMVPMSYWP